LFACDELAVEACADAGLVPSEVNVDAKVFSCGFSEMVVVVILFGAVVDRGAGTDAVVVKGQGDDELDEEQGYSGAPFKGLS
jgi:hypothetical protein